MKLQVHGVFSVIVALLLGSVSTANATALTDDFEDGVIDPAKWVVGGTTRGTGVGDWQWSHEEVVAPDGYLRTRVWGPTSSNSYGAEAWVRTTYDYNDGSDYLINFKWETTVNANHVDMFAIQFTDGSIPGGGDLYWYGDKNIGSIDGSAWNNAYFKYEKPAMAPSDWSIQIDADNNMATVYDGPNLTGQIVGQKTLDPGHAWHLRFIHSDATSGGYPAGDNSLYLYDFKSIAEPTWVTWSPGAGGNGHRYALTSAMTSWTEAEAEAEALGGHLVTINNAAEQTWLNDQFPFPDQYWIGLFQNFDSPEYSEPAGGWEWINGDAMAYTNWATSQGEPNNNYPSGEQWGAMHVWAEGLWNDYHDDTVLRGIIEIPGLTGDLNGDGFVGIADLNIILSHWNEDAGVGNPQPGDITGDGFVGIDDLNRVLGNWNAGTPPTMSAASTLPEPATLALLMLGTVFTLSMRR